MILCRILVSHALDLIGAGFEEIRGDHFGVGIRDVAISDALTQGETVLGPTDETDYPIVPPDHFQTPQGNVAENKTITK